MKIKRAMAIGIFSVIFSVGVVCLAALMIYAFGFVIPARLATIPLKDFLRVMVLT